MSKELQFLIYNTPREDIKVNVVMRDETIWLTQRAMAELFGVQIPAINKHLKNIFEEGELNKETTISKMEIVQNEGGRDVKRAIEFYNLDAIISVGYRVINSTLRSPDKPPRKLFTPRRIKGRTIWACRHGRTHPMAGY